MNRSRSKSYQTEVFTQTEPNYTAPKPTIPPTNITINNVKNTIRDKIPVQVPEYKNIKQSEKNVIRPTPDKFNANEDYKRIGRSKTFNQDQNNIDKSFMISSLSGNKSKRVDYFEVKKEDYKTVKKPKSFKLLVEDTNKAKLTFKSGHQVYDPNFKPKGVDHLLLAGYRGNVNKLVKRPARLKTGGLESMTRMLYNKQFGITV
jgi:hypothetical protein